jgi:hypothetical protein
MNQFLVAAAILTILLGLIHSILGEQLIFIKLRKHQLSGTPDHPVLGRRQVGILWATWHLASVLAWCIGLILFYLANGTGLNADSNLYKLVMVPSFGISSVLVFYGTKGKHPGWIVLAAIAILTFLA